jgi:hypothetical protein
MCVKRTERFLIVVAILCALLSGAPAVAYEGRMSGMAGPFGLVEDESDFLIHPAGIASGKGINYYAVFGGLYERTPKWNYRISEYDPISVEHFSYKSDGHAWGAQGRLGMALPAGTGRIGVFLDYAGLRGNYSGYEAHTLDGVTDFGSTRLSTSPDTYGLTFLYGIPAGHGTFGASLGVAYTDEETREFITSGGIGIRNSIWGALYPPVLNLYAFMIPYKSTYWEGRGQLSYAGAMGRLPYALTLSGSVPFSSDNKYEYDEMPGSNAFTMKGDVNGFNVGLDFWLRYPLRPNLSLPFLVRATYLYLDRDGAGPGPVIEGTPYYFRYEHVKRKGLVEAGGGFDYTPCKGARVAGGLYYNYLYDRETIRIYEDCCAFTHTALFDYEDYPKKREHRVVAKIAGERNLKPGVALRAGANVYYGWVTGNLSSAWQGDQDRYSVGVGRNGSGGSSWGVNTAMGATWTFTAVSFEPFISAGFRSWDLHGHGVDFLNGTPYQSLGRFTRTDWLFGLGFALRF